MRDKIQNMPKVQLHDHLDGGLRPETIIELADERGIDIPASDAVELGEWFYRGAAQGEEGARDGARGRSCASAPAQLHTACDRVRGLTSHPAPLVHLARCAAGSVA